MTDDGKKGKRVGAKTPQVMDEKVRMALKAAAEALDIAADWNVDDVQIQTEVAGIEVNDEGFMSTRDLARYLRALLL